MKSGAEQHWQQAERRAANYRKKRERNRENGNHQLKDQAVCFSHPQRSPRIVENQWDE